MNVTKRFFLILTILVGLLFNLQAQQVGLVLSGGGAKGVCHIGVIKALEEEGIPIDYVTGTSMGAIIGGLYVAGYSPAEMEQLVTSASFASWVSGKVDERYRYFFKKPPPNSSWVDFSFNIDSVLSPNLPTNIVSPLVMDFAFMEIFAGAGAVAHYNFDSLMVPFRCMASDISRAQSVVLSNGDLGSAVRASMTFPFYFKPISIDSTLLFDGGMYNNFPSDIMYEEFFPDMIIGSQAASNYGEPEADNVISQLQNMLMTKREYTVICENGIIIKPNLKQVSVTDFRFTQQFIDSGYAMTKRHIAEMRRFVVDTVSKTTIESKRAWFNQKKPDLIVDEIYISGLKSAQKQYIRGVLRSEVANFDTEVKDDPLTIEKLKPAYYKLLAEEKLENIYPKLIYDEQRKVFDLMLDVTRGNQLIAGMGGAVTSSSVNELFLQLQYNYWRKNSFQVSTNAYFGRFYNSAYLEGRVDFPYPKSFYLKTAFVFNKFNYFKTKTYFFEDEDPFFLIEKDNFFVLSGGFPVTNHGIITMEIASGFNTDEYFQTNFYARSDTLDKTTLNFFSPAINFEINTLNRKEYASSGVRLHASARFVASREYYYPGSTANTIKNTSYNHSWLQLTVSYENYYEKIGPVHLGLYAGAHYSTQKYFNNYTSTLLSARAFQPFAESTLLFLPQFRANKFISAGTKNVLSIRKNIDFRAEAYMFLPMRAIEQNFITRKPVRADKIYAYSLGTATVVFHSPIGPISLSLNYYNGESKPWSFFLKFGYLIFNRRPF